jgi:hypothetical protein
MSQFGNFFITDAGADLLSKVQAGGTLQFNRLAIGDGTWPDAGADNSAMTGLLSEKVTMGIQTLTAIGGGKANLASIMMYADLLSTGFYGRELGLFAQDPDNGEILFSAAYSGDLSDWIPATTEVPAYEHAYNLGIAIGSATTLTVQVDQTIVTATVQNLNDHAALTDPHSATSAATASRLVLRDTNGRAQVNAPAVAADIARLAEVDAEATLRGNADSAEASTRQSADSTLQENIDSEATLRANADIAHAALTHLALGETSAMAYRGDRGKVAYDHRALTNNPHAVTAAQLGAAAILTQIKTVDGPGTGLDADLLDGKHASEFWDDAAGVCSLASNGYQKFPSGLILQWGVKDYVHYSTDEEVTFPIAFLNACLQGFTVQGAKVGIETFFGGAVYNLTKTQMTLFNMATTNVIMRWFAIGY